MRSATKWPTAPRESSVVPLHHPACGALTDESLSMPTRGYRKGQSDGKTPRPHLLRCRTSDPTRQALTAEANARALTFSRLIAEILDAHAGSRRLELPHARGITSAAIRELARLGNNLNQIAHQANLMNLHLVATEARAAIAAITDAVRRLA
jgi:hypothetical protein